MIYTLLVPVAGIGLFIAIVLTVLLGFRVIKIKMIFHKILGYLVLAGAAAHGIFCWTIYFPYSRFNLISGTALFIIILLNTVLWRKKIIKFKTHRLGGIIILFIAVLHAINGITGIFNF